MIFEMFLIKYIPEMMGDRGRFNFVSRCNVNPQMQNACLLIFELLPRIRESLLCPWSHHDVVLIVVVIRGEVDYE